MNNPNIDHFLIIDDDPINNMICSKYIKIVAPKADVRSFTDPQQGLDYISLAAASQAESKSIILLDINMPILSGWDVLERFAQLPESVRKCFNIFILSSSVALEDHQKADASPFVSAFLQKPLRPEELARQMIEVSDMAAN
ncbi:MAG: response regulator [Bacteroidota bacterium]